MKSVMTFYDVVEMPEGTVIPAGTIVVVPHTTDTPDPEDAPDPEFMPPYTIVMAGQELERDLYPELSQVYAGNGGFYRFQLENLVRRFSLGFDEDGEIIRGTALIYYAQVRWHDESEDRG